MSPPVGTFTERGGFGPNAVFRLVVHLEGAGGSERAHEAREPDDDRVSENGTDDGDHEDVGIAARMADAGDGEQRHDRPVMR